MTLKGIDVASYQTGLDASKIAGDFVIVKATEGTGYVNPACDALYQGAIKGGKKVGVYHFAKNTLNSAEAEANFFVANIAGYIKHAILVLDWEDGVADVAWAKLFLDRVYSQTGVKPMIYMSESVVLSYNWSSVAGADYGLWIAKYRDMATDLNYNMALAGSAPAVKYWKGYAMWQWTSSGRLDGWSGNLDCNEFYGDKTAWDKYAGGVAGNPANAGQVAPSAQKPAPAPTQTYTVKQGDNLSSIATKYGTTYQHLAAINGIANPNFIVAGQVLRIDGSVPAPKTYTVVSGDNLSKIAAAHGTSVSVLVSLNGIANPNLIFAGQVLRLP